jgi:hypothetical protein
MVKDLINSFTIDLTVITSGDPMLFYQRQLKGIGSYAVINHAVRLQSKVANHRIKIEQHRS